MRYCTVSRGRKPKRRYRDEIAAKVALSRIQSSNDDQLREFVPKRAYRCPNCKGWHLTHKELRQKANV